MTKRYSIAEARDNLASIVHELEAIDNVELTRRGKSVAVLLSKQEYDRLNSRSSGFWQAYKNYAKQVQLSDLDINPSEVFGGLRDRSAGRQVKL